MLKKSLDCKIKQRQSGFTLIELLVVLAIIGLLASILITSMQRVRSKARDTRRKADLVQLQKALELYYNDNGSYPITGGWFGISASGGSRGTTGAGGYIPNLAPNYVGVLPVDPLRDVSGYSGYLYYSPDGINYKLLDHQNGPESFPVAGEPFYDPARPYTAWMITNNPTATAAW